MGKDSEMTKWEMLSFAEQRGCVVKVFNALVDAGVLSNKGKRNATVVRAKLEMLFGCTITTNRDSWQAFVEDSIPKSVESAADRNARKIAESESIKVDLGL
jgi:hypothetical protein